MQLPENHDPSKLTNPLWKLQPKYKNFTHRAAPIKHSTTSCPPTPCLRGNDGHNGTRSPIHLENKVPFRVPVKPRDRIGLPPHREKLTVPLKRDAFLNKLSDLLRSGNMAVHSLRPSLLKVLRQF